MNKKLLVLTYNQSKLWPSIIFLFVLAIVMTSCKKSDHAEMSETGLKVSTSKETAETTFRTKQEAQTYLNDRLAQYAKVIASLARDGEFRAMVNNSIAKKFDGDYNVLLTDLGKLITNVNYSNSGVLADDLRSFKEMSQEPITIDGRNLYPQIYIPFFGDEAIDSKSSDPCLVSPPLEQNYPNPIIVPFDGDETKKQYIFEGISFDKNGLPIKIAEVSECFAKRHTVWAITINERGGPKVSAPTGSLNKKAGSNNSYSVIDTAANRPNIYIGSMAIKLNKESWIKGGSEVEEIWIFSWYNGRSPITGNMQWQVYDPYSDGTGHSPIDEKEVGFFTRNQVSNQTYKWLNVDIGSMSNWRGGASSFYYRYPFEGDYMYICIYERDDQRWETTNIYAADGSTFITSLQFLSNENPFIVAPIKIIPNGASDPAPNTSSFYINNNEIRFNTAHR